MPLVATRNLVDGMVLAEAATALGKTVASAEALVDRQVVARLAEAGIHRVRVTDESFGLAALVVDAEPAPARESVAKALPPRKEEPSAAGQAVDATHVQASLMRVARMFGEYRDDPLMRELCRLAIKCAREGLIRV